MSTHDYLVSTHSFQIIHLHSFTHDFMEFLEDVTKEIDSFSIMEKIPGGKAFLVSFVYDKLTKTHNLAKTDQGLELRDKDNETAPALGEDGKPFTLKSFLGEILSDFIDKEKEWASLEKRQKEAIERREKERLENVKSENYQLQIKYAKASAKNKQVLKSLG